MVKKKQDNEEEYKCKCGEIFRLKFNYDRHIQKCKKYQKKF